jgi:hypothetical protein
VTSQTTGSRFRMATALFVLVSGLVAPLMHAEAAGTAKVKPACHLVTDSTNDAKSVTGSDDPSLDIVSADVATNKKFLTAVIRVAKLTTGSDSQSPLGRFWQISMAVPGANANQLVIGISDGPYGARDGDGLGGKVKFDPATNSISITESLKVLAGAFHAHVVYGKTRLTQFVASSSSQIQWPAVGGLSTLTSPVGATDHAPNNGVSPAVYVAGGRSCLKVGS